MLFKSWGMNKFCMMVNLNDVVKFESMLKTVLEPNALLQLRAAITVDQKIPHQNIKDD